MDAFLIINSNSNIVVEPFARPIIFNDKVIHAVVPVPKNTKLKDLVIFFVIQWKAVFVITSYCYQQQRSEGQGGANGSVAPGVFFKNLKLSRQ
jgi:hypothetical protein